MLNLWQKNFLRWTPLGRLIVFSLAATSIGCLLADFYGLMPMQMFTFCISVPAMLLLILLAIAARFRGDSRLWYGILIGAAAGLIAAVAYDLFRLPFVFAQLWGIDLIVPSMQLFKVFPRFGAMILGQPLEQENYSLAAHLVGWAYHFSNGITFGIMYTAMIGNPILRHWLWAVVMAVGLELGMLFTPYPGVFGIHVGMAFIIVTLAAHVLFGIVMGLAARYGSQLTPSMMPQVGPWPPQ